MKGRMKSQRVSAAVLYVLLGVTAVVVARVDALLVWMYILLGGILLLTLAMMACKFALTWADSPRAALRPWLGAGLLAVVLLVSWLVGSDVPLDIPGYDGTENTPFWLKLADMFLYAMYALLGLAVVLIVAFAVWKWKR